MGSYAFSWFALILFAVGCIAESPVVTIGKGTLKGKYEISRNGNQYETFLGIRYGQVRQRFDVSEPVDKWEGVKDAAQFGPHCAQQSLVGSPATGEEDCLFLNVFTPKADHKKRAVLVYVHGGGFNMGASTESGGSFLVDEDIVLVTINYRLGVLGFLNTRDGVVGGNMGLKDQVLALKWVQENIEHFGGDKDRVTISGNSAGGSSALFLMTSPLAQGLFHGVYAMSGTPLSPFAFMENSIQETTDLGGHLNCNTKNTVDLVACLRAEPLETLILAQKSIQKWNLDLFRILPSIEAKSAQNMEPFLDELPEDRMRKGNFAKVPILMTMTPHEGVLTYSALIVRNNDLLKNLNDEFTRVAPITFAYENDPKLKSRKDQVTKDIRKFYFADGEITPAKELNLTNVYTDAWFASAIKRSAHILGAQTSVYVGLFTHDRTDYSPVRLFGFDQDMKGVAHTEDLSYIFNPTGYTGPIPFVAQLTEEKDIQFSKKFVKIVANFIENGVPKVSSGDKDVWTPVTKVEIESNSLNWFNLDDDFGLLKNPFQERLQFWDNLYKGNQKEEL